jgi:hypothetical protein
MGGCYGYRVVKRSGWDGEDPRRLGPPIIVAIQLTLEQARHWVAAHDKSREAVLNDPESLSWEKKQARDTRFEVIETPW